MANFLRQVVITILITNGGVQEDKAEFVSWMDVLLDRYDTWLYFRTSSIEPVSVIQEQIPKSMADESSSTYAR